MELALRGETLSRLSLSYKSMATNAGQGSGIKYVFPWCRNNATWSTLLKYPTLPTVRKKGVRFGVGMTSYPRAYHESLFDLCFPMQSNRNTVKNVQVSTKHFRSPFSYWTGCTTPLRGTCSVSSKKRKQWHQRGSDSGIPATLIYFSVISIYSFVLFIIHKRARSLKEGNNAGSERKE